MSEIDIGALMKAKQAWETFKGNHPKFEPFLSDIKNRGIPEGTVVGVELKYPDGSTVKSNVRVNETDLELIELAKSLMK